MLSLTSAVRIFLWSAPVDMRKGFDGLQALVRAADMDVFSGNLFVFVSRRADRAKILTWERGGFVLWYKVLVRHAPLLKWRQPRAEICSRARISRLRRPCPPSLSEAARRSRRPGEFAS